MSSIDYWMKQAEKWKIQAKSTLKAGDKRITELESINAKQSERITELEEQYQEESRKNFDAMWERARADAAEAERVKLRKACEAQHEYMKEAQETLTSYLRPGGIEANRCLGLLLSQFDGPAQRALFKQTETALGKGDKKC